jgi:hypothetical protein
MRKVQKELAELKTSPISGVNVISDDKNVLQWAGI